MKVFLLLPPHILFFVVADDETQALMGDGPEQVPDLGVRHLAQPSQVLHRDMLSHGVGIKAFGVTKANEFTVVAAADPEGVRLRKYFGYLLADFLLGTGFRKPMDI